MSFFFMFNKSQIRIVGFLLIVIICGYFLFRTKQKDSLESEPTPTEKAASLSVLAQPIERSGERVTKKPFGIYITPQTSPVSPEKFIGYHTGVDFETFPDEQDADVPIYAICDGVLLERTTATGYGGLAVQRCTINGESVVVVYGHLKLTSIAAEVGQDLKHGEKLALLGKGYSSETSGERKHLHLGIHKGAAINIFGYVQKQIELTNWIDYLSLRGYL